jgi:hypothetical protein
MLGFCASVASTTRNVRSVTFITPNEKVLHEVPRACRTPPHHGSIERDGARLRVTRSQVTHAILRHKDMVIDLTQQLTAKASSAGQGGRGGGMHAADTDTRSQKPPAVSEIFDRPYIETLVNLLRRCGGWCRTVSVTRPPSRRAAGRVRRSRL